MCPTCKTRSQCIQYPPPKSPVIPLSLLLHGLASASLPSPIQLGPILSEPLRKPALRVILLLVFLHVIYASDAQTLSICIVFSFDTILLLFPASCSSSSSSRTSSKSTTLPTIRKPPQHSCHVRRRCRTRRAPVSRLHVLRERDLRQSSRLCCPRRAGRRRGRLEGSLLRPDAAVICRSERGTDAVFRLLVERGRRRGRLEGRRWTDIAVLGGHRQARSDRQAADRARGHQIRFEGCLRSEDAVICGNEGARNGRETAEQESWPGRFNHATYNSSAVPLNILIANA